MAIAIGKRNVRTNYQLWRKGAITSGLVTNSSNGGGIPGLFIDEDGNLRFAGNFVAEGDVSAYVSGTSNASVWNALGSHVDGTTIRYNATTGKLEVIGGSGGGTWGSITGTLSDQADLQTALNGKANSSHSHAWSDITSGVPAYASRWPSWSEVTSKPGTFTPSAHSHATSEVTGLDTALSGKQATITGGATSITSSNLTEGRVLVSDGSGKVAVSAITSTELGYLGGVTSAIQTQLNGKAASSHTHSYLPLVGGTISGQLVLSSLGPNVLHFSGNSTNDLRGIVFNDRSALSADYNDGWLRLNNASEFTNGVYTPGIFRVDNLLLLDSAKGLRSVTGSYGNVQTQGTGAGSWQGYNINGDAVFMSNSAAYGLYDDTNNEWGILCQRNAETRLFHNGSEKLRTESTGTSITGSLVASGDVTAYSDAKVKRQIRPLESVADRFMKIKPVRYKRKDQHDTNEHIGFIAQNVEKYFPEFVQDGNIKSLNYSQMVAPLWLQVQEITKELLELKQLIK